MSQTPDKLQCANVQTPSDRTIAHYPPDAAHSDAHSDAHYPAGSLKALARQRLQEISNRTLPRTLDRTLPETSPHITRTLPPAMCAPNVRLEQAAAEAVKGLSGHITPATLLSKLASEDFTDLEARADPLPFLRSFAIACVWTDFRRDGIAPPGWDQPGHCDKCGPVYLWAGIHVAGCPWCWNRLHGVKIPRPPSAGVVL